MLIKEILVTTALPYANGPLHLGHLLEQIQADIWVRSQRMLGHTVHFLSAEDTHGTSIMLKAEEQGITPEQLIERVRREHLADARQFEIAFDAYGSTHSEASYRYTIECYTQAKQQGAIVEASVEQLYDESRSIFLADRFVKGGCPTCFASDQYGDSCDRCGATYAPADLIKPYSVLSKTVPVLRRTQHEFFDLPQFQAFLGDWLEKTPMEGSVRNKLTEWFAAGLKMWDITRDAPYFGFLMPEKTDKYFYVWLEAPIGYLSTTAEYFNARQDSEGFQRIWHLRSNAEVYHFIGKDIIYFHGLFWPALLKVKGLRLPTNLFVHGHVTLNGQKMSKSKGTFLTAKGFAKHLPPESLRYYYASKLTARATDLDLQLEDFVAKVNSDLVNRVINIAARIAPFIERFFENKLSNELTREYDHAAMLTQAAEVFALYTARDFQGAVRQIMRLADQTNQYIERYAPWKMAKLPDKRVFLHQVCTSAVNYFRIIMVCLKPILPAIAHACEQWLCQELSLHQLKQPLLNQAVHCFSPLMSRIRPEQITAWLAGEAP